MGTGSLSFALYLPVMLLALVWAGLSVAGNVVEGRGNDAGATTMRDLGFGAILLAGLWVAVLAVLVAVQYPIRSSDGLIIIAVAFVFFAILGGVLLALTEVRVGGRAIGAYLLGLIAIALVVLIVLAIV
jgi:hypothetical protein